MNETKTERKKRTWKRKIQHDINWCNEKERKKKHIYSRRHTTLTTLLLYIFIRIFGFAALKFLPTKDFFHYDESKYNNNNQLKIEMWNSIIIKYKHQHTEQWTIYILLYTTYYYYLSN